MVTQKSIISYKMNNVFNKHRDSPSETVNTVPKKDVILVSAYLGFQSDASKRFLKSWVNKFYASTSVTYYFVT